MTYMRCFMVFVILHFVPCNCLFWGMFSSYYLIFTASCPQKIWVKFGRRKTVEALLFPKTQLTHWFSVYICHRHIRSLELRHRLDEDLFVETVQAMAEVSSTLLEYMDYADDLFTNSPTSTFKLIEQSLDTFNSIMHEDFVLVFK